MCCGDFLVATAGHAAVGPLYITIEIHLGQNKWFPRIRANIALIGICCWKLSIFFIPIFFRKNQFSRKLLDKNLWNFKHRNYLILFIERFQPCFWVFCRLGAIILQIISKKHHNHFRRIWPYVTKLHLL